MLLRVFFRKELFYIEVIQHYLIVTLVIHSKRFSISYGIRIYIYTLHFNPETDNKHGCFREIYYKIPKLFKKCHKNITCKQSKETFQNAVSHQRCSQKYHLPLVTCSLPKFLGQFILIRNIFSKYLFYKFYKTHNKEIFK